MNVAHTETGSTVAASPEDRRRAILQAALNVFGRRGFHGALMEEVAQRAGVGKGTLYHHFESKEALLREALLYMMELNRAELEARLAGVTDPLDKLYHVVATEYAVVSGHVDAARVAFTEAPGIGLSPAFRSTMQAAVRRRKQQVRGFMEEAQRQGLVRADVDPEMLALLLLGMVREVAFDLLFLDGPRRDPDQVARTVMTVFLGQVCTRERGRARGLEPVSPPTAPRSGQRGPLTPGRPPCGGQRPEG